MTVKRPRGNKTSEAKRAERRQKEIELMNEGLTQQQMAEALGISRQTFWRDVQELTKQYADGNKESFAELRKLQVGALMDMAKEVHEGTLAPDAGNSIRGFLDSVTKLLGLNAESRSVVAHVSPAQDERYLEFKKRAAGLDESQLAQAFAFMDSMERKPTQKDASWFPPKTIEGEVSQ